MQHILYIHHARLWMTMHDHQTAEGPYLSGAAVPKLLPTPHEPRLCIKEGGNHTIDRPPNHYWSVWVCDVHRAVHALLHAKVLWSDGLLRQQVYPLQAMSLVLSLQPLPAPLQIAADTLSGRICPMGDEPCIAPVPDVLQRQ